MCNANVAVKVIMLLDLKLHIQSTDYGNFLANEPGSITVQVGQLHTTLHLHPTAYFDSIR